MRFLSKTWIIAGIICLTSCENYIMYHSYHHIPKTGWKKGDTVNLLLSINDSLGGFYRLDFLVRNSSTYKYQDLSLYVTHNFPDTTIWKTDTLLFDIADEQGNWLGKGISGLYESTLKMDSADVYIQKKYSIKVIPAMEDNKLTGINDIGIIARKLSGNLNPPPPPPRVNPEEDEQENSESPQR